MLDKIKKEIEELRGECVNRFSSIGINWKAIRLSTPNEKGKWNTTTATRLFGRREQSKALFNWVTNDFGQFGCPYASWENYCN